VIDNLNEFPTYIGLFHSMYGHFQAIDQRGFTSKYDRTQPIHPCVFVWETGGHIKEFNTWIGSFITNPCWRYWIVVKRCQTYFTAFNVLIIRVKSRLISNYYFCHMRCLYIYIHIYMYMYMCIYSGQTWSASPFGEVPGGRPRFGSCFNGGKGLKFKSHKPHKPISNCHMA